MLNLNLLPKKIEQARRKRRTQALMLMAGVLVVTILAGLVLRLQVSASGLQQEINNIKKKKEKYKKAEKEINKLRTQKGQLDNRRQVLRGLLREQSEWLSTLDILAEVLPDNLWYRKIDGRKKGDELELVLEGVALADNEIFELLERLSRQKDIIEVTLEDIGAGSSGKGYTGVFFNMRLKSKPALAEVSERIKKLL